MFPGPLVPAIFVIFLGILSDCSHATWAVVLLTIGVAFSGFQFSGFVIVPTDIAPRYASVIYGISTSVASIPGFVAPIVIGYMTEDVSKKDFLYRM